MNNIVKSNIPILIKASHSWVGTLVPHCSKKVALAATSGLPQLVSPLAIGRHGNLILLLRAVGYMDIQARVPV